MRGEVTFQHVDLGEHIGTTESMKDNTTPKETKVPFHLSLIPDTGECGGFSPYPISHEASNRDIAW